MNATPLGLAKTPAADAPKRRSQGELLQGIIANESWAHAELYDTLYPVVARALQKILQRTPDYEDLVQTSFERIVRTLKKPEAHRIEHLYAWASAIAARVALDELRTRIRQRRFFDRQTELEPKLELLPGPHLEGELHVRSELAWLQGALGGMNPEQAETVLLHDVLGHDLDEIAELTKVSPAAAQKRLSRGHLELKRRRERRERGQS